MQYRALIALGTAAALVAGCGYVRLLRPQVLKQLNPRVVALLNEIPELDRPNKGVVGQLFAKGGLAHAGVGADGVMRTRVRAPAFQYLWEPAVIVMPRGGELEIEFENVDQNHHIAFMPNNGSRVQLDLGPGERGTVRVQLDQPGMYWFGCPVEDHVTRGMLGFILVRGEVAEEGRLERPAQRRPGDRR